MRSWAKWTWYALHLVLVVVMARTTTILLLKQHRDAPQVLIGWLALGFALILANRWLSLSVPSASRSRLQRRYAELDRTGLAFLAFFLLLLVLFHVSYMRASSDGRSYFIQARSLVIDRDVDLANEIALFNTPGNAAIFPVGSALLWLPFFMLGHIWLGVLNLFGADHARDGLSNPYQMAVGLGTLVYGVIALVLIYRIARDYFSKNLAAAATIAVASGSFVVWYLAIDSSFSHGNSLFTVTLFLFIWYRTRDARSIRQWALLGLVGGLMMTVRWQNAIFLLLPAADAIRYYGGGLRPTQQSDWRGGARRHSAFLAALLVGFLPQLIYWKAAFGGWFGLPGEMSTAQSWGESLAIDVLFSSNHGLLAWHPIIFVSLLGVPLFLKRDFYFGALLTAAFALQVYANGAVAMWWGGSAFGGRRFMSCALLFTLGLASLIRFLQKRPNVAVAVLLVTLIGGNVFFMIDFYAGAVMSGNGVSFDRMIDAAYQRLGNPFSFPANMLFAWRHRSSAYQYDQLGLQQFSNIQIDVGGPGDERFLAGGWAGPEGAEGSTFRWAVTEESNIILPLRAPLTINRESPDPRADFILGLRVRPFLYPGAPTQSVEILVNGEPVKTLNLVPDLVEYEVRIPAQFWRRYMNDISFKYGYARAPAELGLSDDTRQLAVMFETISLRRLNPGR
jgi:hypothetical protein